jgi:hypothetical protein
LTRTYYNVSAAEEEDRRLHRGRGDSAEDDAEPEGEGTEASSLDNAVVDVRWPFSPSRTRPAGLLQHQLSEKRERDPKSACSWRQRMGQADGDF